MFSDVDRYFWWTCLTFRNYIEHFRNVPRLFGWIYRCDRKTDASMISSILFLVFSVHFCTSTITRVLVKLLNPLWLLHKGAYVYNHFKGWRQITPFLPLEAWESTDDSETSDFSRYFLHQQIFLAKWQEHITYELCSPPIKLGLAYRSPQCALGEYSRW